MCEESARILAAACETASGGRAVAPPATSADTATSARTVRSARLTARLKYACESMSPGRRPSRASGRSRSTLTRVHQGRNGRRTMRCDARLPAGAETCSLLLPGVRPDQRLAGEVGHIDVRVEVQPLGGGRRD